MAETQSQLRPGKAEHSPALDRDGAICLYAFALVGRFSQIDG